MARFIRAGGPSILKECSKDRCGDWAPTCRQGLCSRLVDGCAAKYVIHTVGPVFRHGSRSPRRDCWPVVIVSRFASRDDHGIRSLAFPSISTGAFGYPVHDSRAEVSCSLRLRRRSIPQVK